MSRVDDASRICKNCKWCRIDVTSERTPSCGAMLARVNQRSVLVVGYPRPVWLCEDHRNDGYLNSWIFGTCGRRGRYYEAKVER